MPGIVAKSTPSGVLFASRINDRFNPMKPIKFNLTILIVGSTLLLAGCSDNWCWPFDCESSSSGVETPDTVATTATANPVTETQTTNAVAETDTASTVATGTTATDFDLSRATFLHTDVSGWSQTTTLSVELSANQICLYYDKTNSWPSVAIDHTSGTRKINVNANPWVFVNRGGQWYGGTFEWLVVGNQCRGKSTVNGDHIKRAPLTNWSPSVGEELYFMIAGLSRFAAIGNVQERSQPVKVIWQ